MVPVRASAVKDIEHNSVIFSDAKVNAVPRVTEVHITSRPARTDWYAPGETIEFTVIFNLPVAVTRDPEFEFVLGGNKRASYVASESSETSLVFRYLIQDSDEDTDGISVNANPIKLDSDDAIKDGFRAAANRQDATVTHTPISNRGITGLAQRRGPSR